MNPSRQTARSRFAFTATLAVTLAIVLQVLPAHAVSSRSWRMRERADFENAELKTISLSHDGILRLAPPLNLLYEAEQPFIWALAQDGSGNIYASGGNDGVIYRIDASGRGAEFFRADEPEVQALAVDAQGRVYAGTAPGGRIYRIEPTGEAAWTFQTEEEYVWSLVVDDAGNLYAGTGVEGRIIKLDPSGHGQVFFDSAETHIRTLVREPTGHLLAGSAGHGLVFRIDENGNGFVVYDAPLDEVVTLVAGEGGAIYAATAGGIGRRPAPGPRAPSQAGVESGPPVKDGAEPNPPPPQTPPQAETKAEQRINVATEGMVLEISADGYAREVWSGRQEVILSLALSRGGGLMMGSSVDGRIYFLNPGSGDVTVIGESPSGQVTALARRAGPKGKDDEILVGGSNLGTVSVIRPGYAPSGEVESPPLDAQSFATWGRISWRADAPRGTAVTIQARSGNTENPDRTWSDWGEELTDPKGAVLNLPAARFLQWRAILESTNTARTPQLHEVTVNYLQRNLPPTITQLSVQPQRGAADADAASQKRPGPGGRGDAPNQGRGARLPPRAAPRHSSEPGVRAISWQASDPNQDRLVFDVDYRAVDESTWKRLRSDIKELYVDLDTTAIPDGTYIVRLIASDTPSNPPEQSLTDEKLSTQFDVDNTPPRVERLKTELQSPAVRLQFTVSDSFSTVRGTAYSVDAGDWIEAQPKDGLNDDLAEVYDLTVDDLEPGEHSIVVRVTDAAGNVGAGKAIVEVP